MTKYEKAASRAIDSYLYANRSQKTFSLYYLACIADKAAFAAGKKKELYPHLDSYRKILPPRGQSFLGRENRFIVCTQSLSSG